MIRIFTYQNPAQIIELMKRKSEDNENNVTTIVQKMIDDIKYKGDDALFEYAKKLDNFSGDILVSEEEKKQALSRADNDYIRILKKAKLQIEKFHINEREKSWSMSDETGVIMGQMVLPIEKVALYVPGGTAIYPSSVLMNAIPAKIAGVSEISILTPSDKNGKISDEIILAAEISGVDKIYKIGGAHGVIAAAYGTNSIPKVDKIVGPGNIYVATAKKLCYGIVDIDMIAGPSEIAIIADDSANEKYIASDLIAQAEHDKMASSILITTSEELAKKVQKELEKQLKERKRENIARESIENYGAIFIVENIEDAIFASNTIAPEHLEILTKSPFEILPKIKNAGSVFLGNYSPEVLGDYMAGANHVLPTSSTARFNSPLGVYDFCKKMSYTSYSKEAFYELADDVIKFANSEGLDGHANSIKVRLEN